MASYLRFEKRTPSGTMTAAVARDGKHVLVRSRRARSKATGRVAAGATTSRRSCSSEAAATALVASIIRDLLAERFVQVGGPRVVPEGAAAAKAPAPRPRRAARPRGRLATGRARPAAPALRVTGRPRPASAAALDEFVRTHARALPASYRRFVAAHGAGELLGFVRIHAPRSSGRLRLASLVALVARRAEAEARPALAQAFLAFADTAAGDLIGWRIRARGATSAEPAVVIVRPDAPRVRPLARSFDELITKLTRDARFVDRVFPGLEPDAAFVAR